MKTDFIEITQPDISSAKNYPTANAPSTLPYKLPAQPTQPDSQPVTHTPVVYADTSQQDTNARATEPDLIDAVNPNKTYSQVWKNEINTPKHFFS